MTFKYYLAWEDQVKLPNDFIENSPSKIKACNTFLSRYALVQLLQEELNQIITFEEYKDLKKLEIENHLNLVHYPNYLVSISHTKNVATAIIANVKDYKSIGIDLEFSSRVINSKITKFYRHDNDIEDDDLLLWSKKEAAFKALFPLWMHDKTFVLKDIWVKDNEFGLLIDEEIKGHFQVDKASNDLLVCVAIILK
jgi:phosphopantetheinyl transferase (holo-ACP synthase)